MRWLAIVLMVFAAQGAQAAVYKCQNQSGGTFFSDKPCPNALRKEGGKWIDVEDEKKRAAEEARKAAEQQEIADRERRADLRKMAERHQKEAAIAAESARRKTEQFEKARQDAIAQAKASGRYVVEYVVGGSASYAGLTLTNASGGTEQHDVSLPYRNFMTVRKGFFAYISAQNKRDYGTVTVDIFVNGVLTKSSRSESEYGIASASGAL